MMTVRYGMRMVFFILLAFGLSGCRDYGQQTTGQCVNSTSANAKYTVMADASILGDVAPNQSKTFNIMSDWWGACDNKVYVSFNGTSHRLHPYTEDYEGCRYSFPKEHVCDADDLTAATVVDIPATDAALSNLAIRTGSSGTLSAESLSPAFSVVTPAYSITVPYAKSQISITPTARQASATSSATITVNGAGVTSGSASSPPIDLNVGANTIPVVVTSPDGTKTYTYTVNVTRSQAPSASIKFLQVTSTDDYNAPYTPAFSPDTLAYSKSISQHSAGIFVSVGTNNGTATTVKVNGVSMGWAPQSNLYYLVASANYGENVYSIVSTAADGVTTKTYTLTVNRAIPAGENADLSALTISSGTLTPVFSSAVTSYTVSVPNSVASVTVTPTVAQSGATVRVNGQSVTPGSVPGAILLNPGNNTIPIVVTATDGVSTKTYNVTVTRAAANADLSALTISSGTPESV